MAKKTITIEAKMGQGYAMESRIGKHVLHIDQPEDAGGTDTGVTPLQYYLLSLGGCIAAIARIVALQKKISLRSVSIKIQGELDTDVLMGKNREQRAGFTDIALHVALETDMSIEEKEAFLAEVDKRCPISDNTKHATPFSLLLQK